MVFRKSSLLSLFVLVLLGTEFLYVDAFGGVLRPYHFLMPLVILFLYRYVPRLLKSSVFWSLIGFFSWNLVAASYSVEPERAFLSVGLLAANMGLAIAVALILVSGLLRIEDIVRLTLGVAIFSVIVGAFQVAALHFGGVNLALSASQELQIIAGFSSGLRTEANTFAKYLNVVFLLLLPTLLSAPNWRRSLAIAGMILVGMLLSLTRSAIYGLSVTLVCVYFWYLAQGRGRLIAPRPMLILGLGAAALTIFVVFVEGFNEYAAHKLMNFFSSEEILAGGSSGFRLMSQGILWDAFLASDKTVLLGNGWGQVRFPYGEGEMQAGGAEIIVALAYGGILGGAFYLLYQVLAINAARRLAKSRTVGAVAPYEGVMFALLGLFVTGQINGAMIAPEYWMLYGIAIYLGYANVALRSGARGATGRNSSLQSS